MTTPPQKLVQYLGLPSLVLFGLGDILGAGIYGLMGEAAGHMGYGVWAGFLVSAFAAGLTAMTYASLGSRYPKAAGTPYILGRAFKSPQISYIIGFAIWASAITSLATAAQIFSGYATEAVPWLPRPLLSVVLVLSITLVVFWGIKESIILNNICSIIEIVGLLLIIVAGISAIAHVDFLQVTSPTNPSGEWSLNLLFSGALLTFYSFVGFEDMLNVAEEVKHPRKNIPRGLLMALGAATLIYLLISLIAVALVPPHQLAKSSQPLVDVITTAWPWFPPGIFRLIALFAVLNTMLLNTIMASRLSYGMANQGLLPLYLGRVHPSRRTPHVAIGVVFLFWIALTLLGDLGQLARATSVLLLISYTLMNMALIKVQRMPLEPQGEFDAPAWSPYLGAGVCLTLLAFTQVEEWYIAGSLIVLATGLYYLYRPK